MAEYWYNTKTGAVEKEKQSIAIYLVGPFDTRAEAEKAMDVVKARSDAWASEEAAEDARDWPERKPN